MKAAIVGIGGATLRPEEAALFRTCPPAGVILFGRNVVDPQQLAHLMADLRRVLPRDAVFMPIRQPARWDIYSTAIPERRCGLRG